MNAHPHKRLSMAVIGEDGERGKAIFQGLEAMCSKRHNVSLQKAADVRMLNCTVHQFNRVLKENAYANFYDDFTAADERLLLATDTESQDYLDMLEGVIADSPYRNDHSLTIMRLSDAVAQTCHQRGVHNLYVPRIDKELGSTDFGLERRLSTHGVRTKTVQPSVDYELRHLCLDAVRGARQTPVNTKVVEDFWNAWHVSMQAAGVQMVLLDHCNLPSLDTKPSYIKNVGPEIRDSFEVYVEAICNWMLERLN